MARITVSIGKAPPAGNVAQKFRLRNIGGAAAGTPRPRGHWSRSAARAARMGEYKMFRKAMNLVLISGAILTVVACNTVRGAGKDIESTANATSNAMH
jgi:predicted small secreted protein